MSSPKKPFQPAQESIVFYLPPEIFHLIVVHALEGKDWISCLNLFLRLNSAVRDFILNDTIHYMEQTMIKSIRVTWKEVLNHTQKFSRITSLLSFDHSERGSPTTGMLYSIDCYCADAVDETQAYESPVFKYVFFDCVLFSNTFEAFEKPLNSMTRHQRLLAYFTPGLLSFLNDKREKSVKEREERFAKSKNNQEKPSWKARWNGKLIGTYQAG